MDSYYTFDWQTAYNLTKDWRFTFGITNLFDKDPPFSIQTAGGATRSATTGVMPDPIGRAYYARVGSSSNRTRTATRGPGLCFAGRNFVSERAAHAQWFPRKL